VGRRAGHSEHRPRPRPISRLFGPPYLHACVYYVASPWVRDVRNAGSSWWAVRGPWPWQGLGAWGLKTPQIYTRFPGAQVWEGGPWDSDHTERSHSGPETTHRGSRYGLRESEPAAGRRAHMKHVAPHEISGPKSARPHGGIPSPGAEQRRGQWVVSSQGFKKLKKAMHGTYISYCRRAMFGTSAPPLLSLRAAIYSPVPFIGCAGSLTSSFDPVVLPI
jgi:hypothetical protein